MDNVNGKIQLLMTERGWTEYRLAKEAKLSQSTIANLFKRNNLPSIPTLQSICDAFGIKMSQFFEDNFEEILDDYSVKTEMGEIESKINEILEMTRNPTIHKHHLSRTLKSDAEQIGESIKKIFIESGEIAPDEALTPEVKERIISLVRAAIDLRKDLTKES